MVEPFVYREQAIAPSRMIVDGDTWALWKMEEAAGTIANLGAAGTSMDLVRLQGDAGLGYAFLSAGVDRRVRYESALALVNELPFATNAVRWQTGTGVVFPGSAITLSAIVTPQVTTTTGGYAGFLSKEYNPASWAAPFNAVTFGYEVYGATGYEQLGGHVLYTPTTAFALTRPRTSFWSMYEVHTAVLQFEWGAAASRLWIDGLLVGVDLVTVLGTKDLGTGAWVVGSNFALGRASMTGLYHELRVDTVLRDQAWVTEHWARAKGFL